MTAPRVIASGPRVYVFLLAGDRETVIVLNAVGAARFAFDLAGAVERAATFARLCKPAVQA